MDVKKRILVIRLSAMGDVAMAVPVIRELLQSHPNLEITFITKPQFKSFFYNIPRLKLFTADTQKIYAGFWGILKLYRDLKKLGPFDGIADLHSVLRSKILRKLFKFNGVATAAIGKGRAAKRKLTRKKKKELKQLKLTTERYADVFNNLGFEFELSQRLQSTVQPLSAETKEFLSKGVTHIGMAPFAKHKMKRLPFAKAREIMHALSELPNSKILLFGGGPAEEKKLDELVKEFPKATSIAGQLTLNQELNLISRLNVMVSMDSSNMHMASLVGTPVVSIWGATHPYAGFMGYGQSITNSVQTDLECRPCSVYGDKPCWRKDLACMNNLDVNEVLMKVSQVLTREVGP